MIKMRSILAALVLVSAAAVSDARASFTYSVAPASTTYTFGGSTLIVAAFNNGVASPVLAGNQSINAAQITQTSTTVAPATDTGSFGLPPLVITINNQTANPEMSPLIGARLLRVRMAPTQ